MTEPKWPNIGQGLASLHTHAAQLKVHIARLDQRMEEGAHDVPINVVRYLTFSVNSVLDNILDDPEDITLYERLIKIEATTEAILKRTSILEVPDTAGKLDQPASTSVTVRSVAPPKGLGKRTGLRMSTKIVLQGRKARCQQVRCHHRGHERQHSPACRRRISIHRFTVRSERHHTTVEPYNQWPCHTKDVSRY